jgi:hypothetical protein
MTERFWVENDPATHDRASCVCRPCICFRMEVREELRRVRLRLIFTLNRTGEP